MIISQRQRKSWSKQHHNHSLGGGLVNWSKVSVQMVVMVVSIVFRQGNYGAQLQTNLRSLPPGVVPGWRQEEKKTSDIRVCRCTHVWCLSSMTVQIDTFQRTAIISNMKTWISLSAAPVFSNILLSFIRNTNLKIQYIQYTWHCLARGVST